MGKERKNDYRESAVYKEVARVCDVYKIECRLLVKSIKISISSKDDCEIFFRSDRVRVNLHPNLEDKYNKVNNKWYIIKDKYKYDDKIINPTPFVLFANIEAFIYELYFGKKYERIFTYNEIIAKGMKEITIPKLDKNIIDFIDFIHFVDNDVYESIDFRTDSKYLGETEGYKKDVYKKVNSLLQYTSWKKKDIGTEEILKKARKAYKHALNLINGKFALPKFLDKLDPHSIDFKPDSERVLYDIYCGDDEKYAFEQAVDTFGGVYPVIAFLFFIKDSNRFLPTSPLKIDENFRYLGIDFSMSGKCSWENYCGFISIIKNIQNQLNKYKFAQHSVSLLDAHSFVWIINHEKFIEWKKNTSEISEMAEQIDGEISGLKLEGHSRKAVVNQRVGQGIFRDLLLKRYKKCCLCDVSSAQLLRASHIKPWSDSDSEEKLNVENGFMMCPNHDLLFDRGYISFEDNGKIIISDMLSDIDKKSMNVNEDMKIKLTNHNIIFLKYHRDNIFGKNIE